MDYEWMARTIYGEARGEYQKLNGGIGALVAVGNVIYNRFQKQKFGKTIKEVCLKPWQFSCWNEGDPNRPVIEKVDLNNHIYDLCIKISKKIVNGEMIDLVKGADHYHAKSIYPYWVINQNPVAQIGEHIFYKLEG